MKRLNIFLFLFFIRLVFGESLWREEGSIYSKSKRWTAGDTIKIIFNEKSIVEYNNLISDMSKSMVRAEGGSGTFINFLPALGGQDNFSVSQKSSTRNKKQISTSITAQVLNVLPNGNLQISANHSIIINDQSEVITITGEVNPKDIKNKKFVYSNDVINASINYQSKFLKPSIIQPSDYVAKSQTNISVVSGKTQINITTQYEISEQRRNQLILEYLNKILSVLFRK